uniref:Thioredoxin-like_fold domain-containing protein n=1 Tax=Panagrellus redivivus TaxID=6233 RepID=A0A7E4VLS5_PANRE
MVLNNLIGHVLRGARVRQFLGESPSANSSEAGSHSPVEISLEEALNINKYTFFVVITAPFPTIPPNNPGPKDVLDENAFVLKELVKYVSSMKKAKETLSTIIYDKSNSVDIAAVLAKLPSEVKAFVFTSKLRYIQEADMFRAFNISRKLSIALIERKAPNDLQIINTVTHNILKSDNRPAWPWSFADTRIIYNEPILKPVEGKLVPQTNVYKKSWKFKAVFFFNWMIPLCRNFVQTLWTFYNNMIKTFGEDHFEIFGVMLDIEKYNDHVLFGMPWCTLKSTREQLDCIKYTFGVSHVPSLVFLDENDDIITRNGRALVIADPDARCFDWTSWTWDLDCDLPWKGVRPWNYYLIFEVPSLIIFGDLDDDGYISTLIDAVGDMQRTHVQRHLLQTKNVDIFSHQKLTRNQFISGSTMLLHKSLEDEEFLVRYGLGDLSVPLAVIFDPFVGVFVCDDEQISEEIIKNFVIKFQNGELSLSAPAVPPSANHNHVPVLTNKTTHSLDPVDPKSSAQ